jgi:hypothetical protein
MNFPVPRLCRDCDKRKEGIRPFVGTRIGPTHLSADGRRGARRLSFQNVCIPIDHALPIFGQDVADGSEKRDAAQWFIQAFGFWEQLFLQEKLISESFAVAG